MLTDQMTAFIYCLNFGISYCFSVVSNLFIYLDLANVRCDKEVAVSRGNISTRVKMVNLSFGYDFFNDYC